MLNVDTYLDIVEWGSRSRFGIQISCSHLFFYLFIHLFIIHFTMCVIGIVFFMRSNCYIRCNVWIKCSLNAHILVLVWIGYPGCSYQPYFKIIINSIISNSDIVNFQRTHAFILKRALHCDFTIFCWISIVEDHIFASLWQTLDQIHTDVVMATSWFGVLLCYLVSMHWFVAFKWLQYAWTIVT